MTDPRRIVLATDGRGEEVARHIVEILEMDGHDVQLTRSANAEHECGAFDYPDEAFQVGQIVSSAGADFGILVSGSGIGMCITANKYHGIRAVIAHDEWIVRRARAHHDCNVLCVPSDLVSLASVKNILDTWLNTAFEGGRHKRRVLKIAMVERGEDPSTFRDDAP